MASIRRRLMGLIFAGLTLVWAIALVSSYRQATAEVGEWKTRVSPNSRKFWRC